MLDNLHSDEILFLDIETVPQQRSFNDLDDDFRHLWEKKSTNMRKPDETAADVYQRAGIYAEFGKIICISTGYIHNIESEVCFRTKSFFGDDEKVMLQEFASMMKLFSAKKNVLLAAHNGKEFDFPYIARRMLINGIQLPRVLDIAGKKPWEINHLDTLELWKFGDYKSFTSLALLTKVFGIPSPKDDIDGSQVASVYYDENNLERIVRYCEKDVLAVALLFQRYRGDELIKVENVQSMTVFAKT